MLGLPPAVSLHARGPRGHTVDLTSLMAWALDIAKGQPHYAGSDSMLALYLIAVGSRMTLQDLAVARLIETVFDRSNISPPDRYQFSGAGKPGAPALGG